MPARLRPLRHVTHLPVVLLIQPPQITIKPVGFGGWGNADQTKTQSPGFSF